MSLKPVSFAAVFGAAMLVSASANATVVTYDNKADWLAAAGSPVVNTTTDGRPAFPYVTDITLADGTPLSLSENVIVAQAGTSGWQTWSGGYTGAVYDVHFSNAITISLSGMSAFGLEIEPAPQQAFDITMTLSDGKSLTQNVNGNGGALFFGWTGEGIDSFTISSSVNVGFGNIYSVLANPAPEPLTLSLFGAGLAGIGALRRRKTAA